MTSGSLKKKNVWILQRKTNVSFKDSFPDAQRKTFEAEFIQDTT